MSDPKVNDRRVSSNLVEIWTGREWVVQPKANTPPGGITTDQPHPLTDEICRQIAPFSELWSPTAECHDMRSAADWQLDRDAEHFAEYLVKRLIKFF